MSKLSRREFLENSMFAATAAAGSSFLLNNPEAFAVEESRSPNEVLRVAVLGVNGRGQSHLSAFMGSKETEVVAIVDPDENVGHKKGVERVEKTTGKKPAFYQDLRKVMDDKSIDIISIATPNHWHSLAAIWGIQAGKDVYCEKPVSHNVSEGRRVVQAARKHKKIVQTGTQGRSAESQIGLIEFVQTGGIGTVKLARGLCYKRRKSIGAPGNYDVPAGVDYNVWLGPAPEAPLTRKRFHYDWHWQYPYGNGDIGNQGIHQMDIARWGLGVSDLGNSIFSYGGRLGYEDAGNSANTQVSIHDFGEKKLVFETRGLDTKDLRGARVGVIFYGTEGYAVSTSNYSVAAAFDLDGNKIKEFKGGEAHFANFISAVRSRKVEDLNADILEGHLSSALCHLGNVSYRLAEPLVAKEIEKRLDGNEEALKTFNRTAQHLSDNQVDLEKVKLGYGPQLMLDGQAEVFVGTGTDKANAMLTRKYRAPFVVPDEKDV